MCESGLTFTAQTPRYISFMDGYEIEVLLNLAPEYGDSAALILVDGLPYLVAARESVVQHRGRPRRAVGWFSARVSLRR